MMVGLLGAGCSAASSSSQRSGRIVVVGAENQYASVLGQVGGKYVGVTAIMSNPNTDPHTFEASPSVAQLVGAAQLVIQNGLGYDAFMNRIEAASPNSIRRVIDVQTLLGLPDSTSNPHLWYRPSTMPAVAKAAAADLSALEPAHASYFHANEATFDAALKPWYQAITQVKAEFPAAPVATSEPVGDYLLQSAGTDNLTPWPLQADIMNGVDPSPEDVSIQQNLFSAHRVRVFVYNQQVADSLTQTFLSDAKQAGIPVVGVYETMPIPGYDYQSWMLAETHAILKALKYQTSTQRL